MFDGFRSRWMMPFWCACWTAWQTGMNSSSRWRGVSLASSQYFVSGTPLISSMTKNGRPVSLTPASSTLAMFGWSMSASACRSCSNRARTRAGIDAGLDDLERHPPLDRFGLVGDEDDAHAALAEFLAELEPAGEDLADLQPVGRAVGPGAVLGRPVQDAGRLFVGLE